MATEQGEMRGVDAVVEYLEQEGIAHDVVDHEQTFSAAAEARAAGVPADDAAKTMVLRDQASYRLVVLPASERLDLGKAREALGASRHLRLATEAEMQRDFDRFEVGAVPPFAPIAGKAPEVVDRHLLDHERILCTAGDHRHSVLVAPDELVRATEAQVVEVCESEQEARSE